MEYFASSIEFITQLSTDTLLLIFLLIGFFVASLYLGKDWAISFILSLFISNILYARIPFDLPIANAWYEFGTIILIALILTTIVKKFIESEFPRKRSKRFIQAAIVSMIVTVTLLVTGLTNAYTFSPLLSQWITGDFLFWASLIPFAVLLFFIRK